MMRLNRAHESMKVLQHDLQMVNNVLTRAPMNGRLYHTNYNTSKIKEGFMSKLSGVDPKEK
jgi:hypothetical protein